MKRALLPLWWFSLACEPFAERPLELDSANRCAEVTVDLLIPNVQSPNRPWQQVIFAAADAPGRAAAWLLVTRDGELALLHLQQTGVVDQDIPLQVSASAVTEFELLAGPTSGDAWLVRRGFGRFEVTQFQASQTNPRVGGVTDLGWFPGECPGAAANSTRGCDTRSWRRDLVFIQGLPHVLTVAPNSRDETISAWVGRIQQERDVFTLASGVARLRFRPDCDRPGAPDECPEPTDPPSTYPRLTIGAMDRSPRTGSVAFSLLRERHSGFEVGTSRDFAMVLIGINALGSLGGAMWTNPDLPAPMPGTPTSLAVDAATIYGTYIDASGDTWLTRVDRSASVLEALSNPLRETELLQLQDDVALGVTVYGLWLVETYLPSGKTTRQTTVRRPIPIVAADQAGPGAFVLRTADQTADLVGVRCAEVAVRPPP